MPPIDWSIRLSLGCRGAFGRGMLVVDTTTATIQCFFHEYFQTTVGDRTYAQYLGIFFVTRGTNFLLRFPGKCTPRVTHLVAAGRIVSIIQHTESSDEDVAQQKLTISSWSSLPVHSPTTSRLGRNSDGTSLPSRGFRGSAFDLI